MESHDDRIIFELAAAEQRIVLTQDSDFGPIHTAAKVRTGVLLLRLSSGRPSVQAGKVLAALPVIERALLASSMVILLDDIAWIANPST